MCLTGKERQKKSRASELNSVMGRIRKTQQRDGCRQKADREQVQRETDGEKDSMEATDRSENTTCSVSRDRENEGEW